MKLDFNALIIHYYYLFITLDSSEYKHKNTEHKTTTAAHTIKQDKHVLDMSISVTLLLERLADSLDKSSRVIGLHHSPLLSDIRMNVSYLFYFEFYACT